ncbi:hypothetical protein [Marinomonas epiphytica]
MSGSIPHTIALANNTATDPDLARKQFDIRSEDDTRISELHARNAQASSDLVVTLSEQAQQANQEHLRQKQQRQEQADQELHNQRQAELAQRQQEWLEDQQSRDNYEKQTKTGEYVNITI